MPGRRHGVYGAAETFFGVGKAGRGIDVVSLYARSVPMCSDASESKSHWGRQPSFDVSNNVVACSCGADGLPRRVVVVGGSHSAVGEGLPGVYVHKELLGADVDLSVKKPSGWTAWSWQGTVLWHGLFPKGKFMLDSVVMETLTFAPVLPRYSRSPQAVVLMLSIENRGGEETEVEVQLDTCSWSEQAVGGVHGRDFGPGLCSVVPLTQGLSVAAGALRGMVGAGSTVDWAVALCIGADEGALSSTVTALASRSPEAWLKSTEVQLTSGLEGLSTEPEGYVGGLFGRQLELCRQSLIYGPAGKLAGGFWGSDVNDKPEVWMRDNFYAALGLAWFAPEICADAAHFYAATGWPERAWGRGVARFEDATGATHSVGNAVAAVVLAGAYLRATGDVQWLQKDTRPYEYGVALFEKLERLRNGPYDLFPSLYISDGDARGDWHSGSNIVAWRALMDMAEMAQHALDDVGAAERWRQKATKLRASIVDYCVGSGPKGPQLFEGVFRDGSYVAGHDGEESDLTLASYYGFMEADDPLVVHHAQLAFSEDNPMYWSPLQAVQWWDDGACLGPTFPAYVHELAGVESEDDLGAVLDRLRTLADIDGSFWWWPYRPFSSDPYAVERGPGKAGWAAGVFVCRLLNDVFGLRANALTRQLKVLPFCPWSWQWYNVKIGTLQFDVNYEIGGSARRLVVGNRGDSEIAVSLEVIGPDARMPTSVVSNGEKEMETWAVGWRYGRRTVIKSMQVRPGQELELQCSWAGTR